MSIPLLTEPVFTTLDEALRQAVVAEAWAAPRLYYVVKTIDGFEVVDSMPLLGTWWTSNGIRHG
jgi:hypothetical protein